MQDDGVEAMVLAGEWDPWKLESVRASAVLFSMLLAVCCIGQNFGK